jgi:LPXTG-site transpeptidase (sortase) family protein
VLGTCVIAAAVLLSGCAGQSGVRNAETQGPSGSTVIDETAPYVVEPAVELRPVEDQPPARRPDAGAPTRLVVPDLDVNAPVIPIRASGGVLIPPGDPQVLGWWRDGAVPGAAQGGALITGHTVHSGGGAFDDLETLEPGDRVVVRTVKGRVRYAVTGVTIYRKASLAQDAARVFRQSGPGRLVLITCEDWNGSGYDSNAVVFAEPV